MIPTGEIELHFEFNGEGTMGWVTLDGRCEYTHYRISPLGAEKLDGCLVDNSSHKWNSFVSPLRLLFQDERMEFFLSCKFHGGFFSWMSATPFKGLLYDYLIVTNKRIIFVIRDIFGHKTEFFRRPELTGLTCDGSTSTEMQTLRFTFNNDRRTISSKGGYCADISSRL